MKIAQEFKAFIAKGNVMDLAVGVIIGAAFGKIVDSVIKDLVMPVIGFFSGGIDFSNRFILLSAIPKDFQGNPHHYSDLIKAGVAVIGYGSFLTAILNFFLLSIIRPLA